MTNPARSDQQILAMANGLGTSAVVRAMEEAAAALKVEGALAAGVVTAARKEANARRPVVSRPAGAGAGTSSDDFEFATVLSPQPGQFNPRVIQLRLSPFIASAAGAVAGTLGSVPALGWLMVGLAAAIALRDFWKKKVTFDGVHGQLLFEMYRSTNSGKDHHIPVEHLYTNVNLSRADAKEPPLGRPEFDLALHLLMANGILSLNSAAASLAWTELAIELDA